MEKLEQILKRCEAAAPGPWRCQTGGYDIEVSSVNEQMIIHSVNGHKAIRLLEDDGEFIAHSRTDLPLVVKALQRAMDALEKMKCCRHVEVCDETANCSIRREALAEIEAMLGEK